MLKKSVEFPGAVHDVAQGHVAEDPGGSAVEVGQVLNRSVAVGLELLGVGIVELAPVARGQDAGLDDPSEAIGIAPRSYSMTTLLLSMVSSMCASLTRPVSKPANL